ncbi:MAG: hypothetical protein HY072_04845 [Deltaproteobacteria bacterium]|nr:hypothetical protein [Deltaproteobacteria bacterium]
MTTRRSIFFSFIILNYFFIFLFIYQVYSDEKAQASKQQGSVLDFEADVIQGERQKPDIFLQLSKQNQTLESIIFMRKDFKDFHNQEKNWRPSYLELRKAPEVKK